MKKSPKSSQDESLRTNVLLEEVRSNFKLLAEGQQGTNERIERLETIMDNEFAKVRKEIAELRKDVTMVLKNHEARLHTLETTK